MRSPDYHFVTRWRVNGTCDEVGDVLSDPLQLPRWWPSVYLRVTELTPGDADGIGRVVDLYTKGWLPYTLRWRFTTTESRRAEGFSLDAEGDFVGRGVWTFVQDGAAVDVTFDWRIAAHKPLLRRLTLLLRPLFAANHHWAMRQGLTSLRLELERRRAATPEARAGVPAPPGPTFAWLLRSR